MKNHRIFSIYFALLALLSAPPAFSQTNWTKHPANPVVNAGGPGQWDSNQVFFPSVLLRDSTYMMWYGGGPDTFRTGRATSSDGITWQKDPLNPVLNIGPKGAWDNFEAWLPSVLYDGNRYRMWYSGASGCFLCNVRLGYATSVDGRTWLKDSLNPISTGNPGYPRVHMEGTVFKSWYSLTNGVGYSTSIDGIQWTESPQNPVLTSGPPGSWDESSQIDPFVLWDSTYYHMWYLPVTDNANLRTAGIGYAISTDGIHWKKYPGNPVLVRGGPGRWDQEVFSPTVVRKGDMFQMWFGGIDQFTSNIGFATSPRSPAAMTLSTSTTSLFPIKTIVGTSTIDFNTIYPGAESDTAHITIGNWGFTPLVIASLSWNQPEFAVDASSSSISPFGDAQLNIVFRPTLAGVVVQDTVAISSNDLTHAITKLALRGRGSGSPRSAQTGKLYGITASPSGAQLFTINITSGNASSNSPLGPHPPPAINGFSIRPSDQIMYAAYSSPSQTLLYRMSSAFGDMEQAGAIPLGRVTAIAFGRNDQLYLVDSTGRLFRTQGIAGDTVFIGRSGVVFTGLAFSQATHTLWASAHDSVFTVDTATASLALVGSNFYGIKHSTLAVGPFGTLYGVFDGALVTVDRTFGTLSLIGPTGVDGPMAITMRNDIVLGEDELTESLPKSCHLYQNYPNPFNPTTRIDYTVGIISGLALGVSHVRLAVYDMLGRMVAVLVDEEKSPGSYTLEFNAQGLASGVYCYRMQAGAFAESKKLLVLR